MVIHDNDLTGNDYEFLSLTDGENTLRILSQKITVQVCRWKEGKKTLLWSDNLGNKYGFKKYSKIFYLAEVNGKKGILDMPYGLLAVISDARRKLQEKNAPSDSRQLEFSVKVESVIKDGYTNQECTITGVKKVVRTAGEIDINTQELAEIVQNLENKYAKDTTDFLSQGATATPVAAPTNHETVETPTEPGTEDIDPATIPF